MNPIELTSLPRTHQINYGSNIQSHPSMDAGTSSAAMASQPLPTQTLYFNEPDREGRLQRIDYILAWETASDPAEEEKRANYRKEFERELTHKYKMRMEREEDGELKFLKLHATYGCLFKLADELSTKLPLHFNDAKVKPSLVDQLKDSLAWASDMFLPPVFPEDDDNIEELLHKNPYNYYTAEFAENRKDKFAHEELGLENFFTVSERNRLVRHVLDNVVFKPEVQPVKNETTGETEVEWEAGLMGISRMVKMGNYSGAYPLHDGHYRLEDDEKHERWVEHKNELNPRQKLFYTWASPRAYYKLQPMDPIRRYFGEKIALYFSWLGYYTQMLAFAAIIGIIVFVIGLSTMGHDDASSEACPGGAAADFVMCPLCSAPCEYWLLSDACTSIRISHIVDNSTTMVFAVFIALWSTLFLEFWKRTQNVNAYEWDLFGFEDEQETLRPEYEEMARRRDALAKRVLGKSMWLQENPVTKVMEPFTPFTFKVSRALASISIVLTMITVVVGSVIAVVLYRIIVSYSMTQSDVALFQTEASAVASATGSTINLICIMVFGYIYGIIAWKLTMFECPRTETEFEDSYTIKMFVFQFVNYYSSIMYIAFYKGKNVGYPGNYNTIAGARQEECAPGGCLFELTFQLAIVMVGKQFINNVQEILVPLLGEWMKTRKVRKEAELERYGAGETPGDAEKGSHDRIILTPWEKDYTLAPQPQLNLFGEYLEMVIQYGFATLFACAFPLAPFFAFINNIIEVRLDAFKFVGVLQRPWAQKAQDIGSWYEILDAISVLAVLFNAFIIAFTSTYIDGLVYKATQSVSGSDQNYWAFIYAEANATETFPFSSGYRCEKAVAKVLGVDVENCKPQSCNYMAYRNDYNSNTGTPYALNETYYHVLAARLIFVIVFEHFVFFVKVFLAYIVPDMPGEVKVQQLREAHLTKTLLFANEEYDGSEAHLGDGFKAMDGSLNVYEPNVEPAPDEASPLVHRIA